MVLEVSNLGYRYPKAADYTIKNIGFTINKGDILCILGGNGSGKTTLLNCIGNLLTPTEGSITIAGRKVDKMSRRDVAKYVGYVPQFHEAVYAYTVREFVTMGRTPHLDILGTPKKVDIEIAKEAIRKMKIEHLADKYYTNLSGGQRQQAMLARVLVQDPQIVILDEPTNHLDYGNQIRALKMIKGLAEQGYAIVMTTHNPEHALMLEDKAAIVDYDQTFIFGPSKQVITEENLRKIYNLNLDMVYIPEKQMSVCVTTF